MVHLAIGFAVLNPMLQFRIIQVDQFPERAEKAGVRSTPTLVLPGDRAIGGSLPPSHFAFHLWQTAMGL